MTPHTTRSIKVRNILRETAKPRSPKPAPFDSISDGIPSYKYSLLALVCHEGKLDTGHYKSFVRVRDAGWFCFDDAKVTKVDLSTILENGNVYMCFYVRVHGEYAPCDVPDVRIIC